MEFQEIDDPHGRPPSGQPMRLAAEYRTLSMQVGGELESKSELRFMQSTFWRRVLNELVPLRTAHEQYETEEQQRDAAISKVAQQLRTLPYHKDTVKEIHGRLGTSAALGLEAPEVTRRRAQYGANQWKRPSPINATTLVRWFVGGFNRFLWVAMVVFWLCWRPIGNPPQPGNMALAIVIIFVICLQALFSAWQQWITDRAMLSITTMVPTETTVLRGGATARVPPADLVPGDIVHLQGGDRAPADLRLVDVSAELQLDRSALSGVAEPSIGTVQCTSANYLETCNIVMAGVHVTQGQCRGIVVATGEQTVLGRIGKLTTARRAERTILQLEVQRLVNGLTTLSLVVGILFVVLWAVWLRTSYPGFMAVADALANGVGVLVTFVPGSLPISLTLALTAIAKRMQRHKVLIKNLTAVETLGTVSAICCEKTGTLTRSRMAVTCVAFANAECTPEALAHATELSLDAESRRLHRPRRARRTMAALRHLPTAARRVFETALLCNAARFDALTAHMPVHERVAVGDATDCALLRMADQIFPVRNARPAFRTLAAVPFSIRSRWMLSVCEHQLDEDAAPFIVAKGAPEQLLPRCTSIQNSDGLVVPLDDMQRRRLEALQLRWASETGCRVLLLCRRDFPNNASPFVGIEDSPVLVHDAAFQNMHGLCVVALVGMVDPLRPEIPAAVDALRGAGVRVLMVTGDYAPTAAYVARQCHVISPGSSIAGLDAVLEAPDPPPPDDPDRLTSGSEKSTCDLDQPLGALVLSGPQLRELQPHHWDEIAAYREVVFARITPEQKQQIVEELRARDHYVAVTGDDVPDLGAMRAAHVSVAMGNGAEVAKEAADIVLLDNSLAALVVAVESGRLVFANLKKVIVYLLPMTNMSEIMPSLFNVVLGLPIPLSTFLMLVINTVSDVWASVVLVDEEPEDDLMRAPPRNPRSQGLVNVRFFLHAYGFIGLLQSLTGHTMFFLCLYLRFGIAPRHVFLAFNQWTTGYLGRSADELARAVAVAGSAHYMALVVMQWGNMFVARTRTRSIAQQNPFWGPTRNLKLLVAIPISVAVALFVNEIHWFNHVFLTGPIPLEFFFIPIPFAFGLVASDEFRKFLVRRFPTSIFAKLAW
ncbi:hypothetical protein EV175_000185 [Coemansia sp. RSA 1933]|nr:hypothetical protein EV175_000185 [Coemansia sp. RSA 1933]